MLEEMKLGRQYVFRMLHEHQQEVPASLLMKRVVAHSHRRRSVGAYTSERYHNLSGGLTKPSTTVIAKHHSTMPHKLVKVQVHITYRLRQEP